jgi:hypothetical protein
VSVIRDEQLPAREVLEEEGYAAWVRTLNGEQVERPEGRQSDRVENSPCVGGFVQA